MSKIILIISLLFSLETYSQGEDAIISKANQLVSEKKYETAFKELDDFDKENNNPKIAVVKSKILLDFFATSIMHQMFALTNIQPNEDISMYRGKNGSYTMFKFDPAEILNKLKKKNPKVCEINNALGEYYFDVKLKYGANWIESEEKLEKHIKENFSKAIENNCGSFMAYYALGLTELTNQKYKESVPLFLKAIEKNKDYGSSHYNLAYAYLYQDDRINAIKYAKNAAKLYSDSIYKAEAFRMIGQAYLELKDNKNALENFRSAEKYEYHNYYSLKPILNILVKSNDLEYKKITEDFFNLDSDNPTILGDLENIYFENKKEDELIQFFNEQLTKHKNEDKIVGGLNFYLGKIYIEKDKVKAKTYFETAKISFLKIFDKDHQVFKALEDGIKQCN